MSHIPGPSPVEPHLLILASGDFGAEVAERLANLYPATVQNIDSGTHPSLWPHADLMILAAASERPRVADAVDRTAFIRAVSWFPVFARPTDLQCGPVVVPGRTACYRCFERRRAQHRHGASGPGADRGAAGVPTGYARHHVGVAVALARRALAEAADGPSADSLGATVRTFNQISGAMSEVPVVAVDGCRRCRGRFGSAEEERHELWRKLKAVGQTVPAPAPRKAVTTS